MKKFLALFLAIIIAITLVSCLDQKDTPTPAPDVSPDGGDASTTTTTTTTAKDYTPKKLNGFSSGGSGEPPITISFRSIEEIQAFMKAANGTAEEFEKYHEEIYLDYLIKRDQELAKDIAHNIDIINFPLVSFATNKDIFKATYYLDRNEFDIIYLADGCRYRFTYYYNYNELLKPETPLFKENVTIADYSLDLHEGEVENSALFGFYMDKSVLVKVIIYIENYEAASFEGITFKPLADIK